MRPRTPPAPVHGIHAPAPRLTPWAALIAATLLSLVFLAGLGLWRVFF